MTTNQEAEKKDVENLVNEDIETYIQVLQRKPMTILEIVAELDEVIGAVCMILAFGAERGRLECVEGRWRAKAPANIEEALGLNIIDRMHRRIAGTSQASHSWPLKFNLGQKETKEFRALIQEHARPSLSPDTNELEFILWRGNLIESINVPSCFEVKDLPAFLTAPNK